MPDLMTRADFAKHRGVSRAAVTQWAAAGRLVLSDDGAVRVPESEAMLAATMNTRGGKRPRNDVAVDAVPEQLPLVGTLTEERTHRERTRRQLDELEYGERVGRLVEHSRLTAGILDGLSAILSRLDSASSRLAPKLIGQTEVRRIQDIVDDEIVALRQEIADTLRAMTAGAGVTKQ